MRKVLLASTIALLGLTGTAQAHFNLMSPASWATLNPGGSPQKSFPCGETDSATVPLQAVATKTVTPFKPGDTVTVTVQETVMHPGWYRVVLATGDRSTLPPDPQVTAGTTPCGTVNYGAKTIVGLKPQDPPVFPVLADGMLFHTTALSGPQTFSVKLPTNVTCDKCTLQIVEFMSDHGQNNPGGCFYHHCADISIHGATTDAGTSNDAAIDAAHDAATDSGAAGGSTGGTSGAAGTSGAGGASAGGSTGASGGGGTTGTAGTGATGGTTGAAGSSNAGAAGTTGAAGSKAPHQSSGGCSLAGGPAGAPTGLGILGLALASLILRARRRT
ncbi:MAG TPA: SCE4755 family polysaccharide monooxygenase-like protein [Polyangia bacterium]|jgi:hypothetical protein|nr:SCE4755 family polysaccharide monooxygenase-like protein [Polyangia bacterium]